MKEAVRIDRPERLLFVPGGSASRRGGSLLFVSSSPRAADCGIPLFVRCFRCRIALADRKMAGRFVEKRKKNGNFW